jgi:hypothetical protein
MYHDLVPVSFMSRRLKSREVQLAPTDDGIAMRSRAIARTGKAEGPIALTIGGSSFGERIYLLCKHDMITRSDLYEASHFGGDITPWL